MNNEMLVRFAEKLGESTFYALFLLAVWLVVRQSKKRKAD